MGKKEKCVICSEIVELQYKSMEEWKINGILCGKCYSKQLNKYYPGKHIRVNQHLD